MKTLHYQVYNQGNVGMCNLLMSIENALLIAKLTNRDSIVFYLKYHIPRSNNLLINDLFDINFNHKFVFSEPIDDIPKLPYDIHSSLFYSRELPTDNFKCHRNLLVDLSEFEELDSFRTKDSNTLGFYSYLFYLGRGRFELTEWLKNSLKPKEKYTSIVNYILGLIDSKFNSLHIRRGDYLLTENKNKLYSISQYRDKLLSNFDTNELLLVHSDELDKEYFTELLQLYPNTLFIDDFIQSSLRHLDYSLQKSEIGLISLLIASYSKNFVGTMMSTFTSFIQRYRLYNNRVEEFKFIYPQDDKILLDSKGRFIRESFSEYTWNHSYLQSEIKLINFWYREWEGCYRQPDINTTLLVVPNFLTSEESKFIIDYCKPYLYSENEYYQRENRNRVTIGCRNNKIISNLLIRSCSLIGYPYSSEQIRETTLQVFVQYPQGETFWHMDSLAVDEKNRIRERSILFYLNEDFKGSKISFPYLGVEFQPKKNTMLSYPLINEFHEMNRDTSHSASLITDGVKYMCYFDLKRD